MCVEATSYSNQYCKWCIGISVFVVVTDEAFVQKLAFQHFNIICGVASKCSSEDKNTIDDKVIKLLDDAREQFGAGFPNLGIPPLDPLILEDTNFTVYQKAIIKYDSNAYYDKI